MNETIDYILEKRTAQGADFWATPDGRLAVGSPFSTLESLQILHEVGLTADHEAINGALDLILKSARGDGRYRIAPTGTQYPCFTANAARILCRFGLTSHEVVQESLRVLQEEQHQDGGWRCQKVALGRSLETDASNPGVTLLALDAFRFASFYKNLPALDQAVETLLDHWESRHPLGPCQFGIGSLFMQVEYPFLRYNLFSYVYVLSFYERARQDERFMDAFSMLEGKLNERGEIIVERPNRKLAKLTGFEKGAASTIAARRYKEIMENLAGTTKSS